MTGSEATAGLNCGVPGPRPHASVSDIEYFPVPSGLTRGCSVSVCRFLFFVFFFSPVQLQSVEEIKDHFLAPGPLRAQPWRC